MVSSAMVRLPTEIVFHSMFISNTCRRMLTCIFILYIDMYAFVIGSYVIWTVIAGARYTIEYVRARRVTVLLSQIWKWFAIVVKSTALLSIWVRMPVINRRIMQGKITFISILVVTYEDFFLIP